jgi:acyl-CoA thioester hydrolase
MTNAQAASLLRRTRVRVRYAETDRMGVVYYANYFVWFEIGRTDWLRETGNSYRAMEEEGIQLPVIEAHCEYRRAATYDDDLEIRTRATMVTPVRIRFDYEIARDDETLVVGYTIHAALDGRGRPCRLPPRVREMIGGATELPGPEGPVLP